MNCCSKLSLMLWAGSVDMSRTLRLILASCRARLHDTDVLPVGKWFSFYNSYLEDELMKCFVEIMYF